MLFSSVLCSILKFYSIRRARGGRVGEEEGEGIRRQGDFNLLKPQYQHALSCCCCLHTFLMVLDKEHFLTSRCF